MTCYPAKIFSIHIHACFNGVFLHSAHLELLLIERPERKPPFLLFFKNDQSPLLRWYLNNEKGRLVGSGIYIVHINMTELGLNKMVKLVVVHR